MGVIIVNNPWELRNFFIPTISFTIGLSSTSITVALVLFIFQWLILSFVSFFLPLFSTGSGTTALIYSGWIGHTLPFQLFFNLLYGMYGLLTGIVCAYKFQRMPLFWVRKKGLTWHEKLINYILSNIYVFWWFVPVIAAQVNSHFADINPNFGWFIGDIIFYLIFIGVMFCLNTFAYSFTSTGGEETGFDKIALAHNMIGHLIFNLLMIIAIIFNKFVPFGVYFSVPLFITITLILCILWVYIAQNYIHIISGYIFGRESGLYYSRFYKNQTFNKHNYKSPMFMINWWEVFVESNPNNNNMIK